MKKEIILIDCDPGIDDAYALLYALADDSLDVRLVSTVSGNVNVDVNTDNALRIVKMSNKDVAVVKGASQPLVKEAYYAEHVHGKNGMNNYKYQTDDKAKLLDQTFLQAYYKELSEAEKPVVIAAIGPLTNIATLLTVYPQIKEKIKYITMMGGGLKGGNTTIAAEFNFYADPEAASIVMQAGVPIIMAGLDVTEKTVVNHKLLDKLAKSNPIGKFLADILDPESDYMKVDKGSLHDVVALMAINHLDIFKTKNHDIYVETNEGFTRGMSIADRRMNTKGGKVKVLVDVDVKRFNNELIDKIKKYG